MGSHWQIASVKQFFLPHLYFFANIKIEENSILFPWWWWCERYGFLFFFALLLLLIEKFTVAVACNVARIISYTRAYIIYIYTHKHKIENSLYTRTKIDWTIIRASFIFNNNDDDDYERGTLILAMKNRKIFLRSAAACSCHCAVKFHKEKRKVFFSIVSASRESQVVFFNPVRLSEQQKKRQFSQSIESNSIRFIPISLLETNPIHLILSDYNNSSLQRERVNWKC